MTERDLLTALQLSEKVSICFCQTSWNLLNIYLKVLSYFQTHTHTHTPVYLSILNECVQDVKCFALGNTIYSVICHPKNADFKLTVEEKKSMTVLLKNKPGLKVTDLQIFF